jgi:tetratricopeptide (TPR) repeat protein
MMQPAKNQENLFSLVFVTVLGLLLFIPPFFSGLFFDVYWLRYQLIIGVIAVTFMIFKKRGSDDAVYLAPLDFTNAALVLSYFISVLVALNAGGAFGEAVKAGTYFLLYFMIAYSAAKIEDVLSILKAFYWSGILVLFISIGAAFGSFDYPAAFLDERIYSTLEYPNTFAAYTICLFIAGLYLAERKQAGYRRIIYSFTNFLLLAGFFGAKSRGGLLTFMVVFFIYAAGLPGKYRAGLVIRTVLPAVVAYLYITKIFSPLPKHEPIYYWALLGVAGVISLLPELLKGLLPEKWIPGKKTVLAVFVAAGVVLFGAFIGLPNNLAEKQPTANQPTVNQPAEKQPAAELPAENQSANRLAKIDFSANEARERLVFFEDALKIARDYPLLGTGGRGWNAVYKKYQGYHYTSTEVHNHYLQVLVEKGALGLTAFLNIWAAALMTTLNLLKKIAQPEDRLLVWSVFCAALALGIHSFIDFNLSIPAVAILLWGLFGCLRALQALLDSAERKWHLRLSVKGRVVRPVSVFLAGVSLALSIILLVSLNYGNKGIEALRNRSYAEAGPALKTAISVNPLAGNYTAALADALILQDRVDQAVAEYEEAAGLNPYVQRYVDQLGETYYLAGKYYHVKKDGSKAKAYLTRAAAYPDLIAGRLNDMTPRNRQMQRPVLQLAVSGQIKSASKMAKDLLAEYK